MINRFLEIEILPDQQKKVTQVFALISSSQVLAFSIVNTFLILFLLDFLSYYELGLVLAINFSVIAVLDFPTGALGDYIGHGRVLRLSYLLLAIGAVILGFSYTLGGVIFSYAVSAIGRSQLSGALESWLDNNYKETNVDHDKQIFGSFKGRLRGITMIINASSFVLGGLIASTYSRRVLVYVHIVFLFFTLFLILRFIPIQYSLQSTSIQDLKSQTYDKMSESIKWIITEKKIFYMFIGFGFVYGIGAGVWFNQILFPYYFAYSKTDFNTGIIRSANYLIGLIWVLFVPYISKRIRNETKPFLLAVSWADPVFFLVCWLYFIMYPPSTNFVLSTFIGVILIFQSVAIGDVLSDVLFSRIMIKSVPNEIRNSIYSLFSTVTTLFAIPFTLIGGWFIENYGFANGILFCVVFGLIGMVIMTYGFIVHDKNNDDDDYHEQIQY